MSTAIKAKKKLTPKQEQFCLEYLIDLNATQAAIRAGYSKKTAQVIGSENLVKPLVQERVTELTQARKQRAEKTADDIIKEYESIGFSRVTNIVEFNESGAAFVKSSDKLSDSDKAAIESVEVIERGGDVPEIRTKIKLHSKQTALAQLSKHHNICRDKLDVSHSGNVTVEVVDYSKKGKE